MKLHLGTCCTAVSNSLTLRGFLENPFRPEQLCSSGPMRLASCCNRQQEWVRLRP